MVQILFLKFLYLHCSNTTVAGQTQVLSIMKYDSELRCASSIQHTMILKVYYQNKYWLHVKMKIF